jgi:hypothetical protein
MATTTTQNIINRRDSLNQALWVAEVKNATSQNTVRVYARSIREALSLVDRYAIYMLGRSVVLSIQLEEN